jgi:hypothetical protein
VLIFSQINLKILDENGNPVSDVNVNYNSKSYKTNVDGFVKIPVAETEQTLTAEKETFTSFQKNKSKTEISIS